MNEDDEKRAAQRRFLLALEGGFEAEFRFVFKLISDSPYIVSELVSQYTPESDARIMTRDEIRKMLQSFANDLLDNQAKLVNEWSKKRK